MKNREHSKICKGLVIGIILLSAGMSLPVSSAVLEKGSEETELSNVELEEYINLLGEKEKKIIDKALDLGIGLYFIVSHTGLWGDTDTSFIPFILRLIRPSGFVIAGRIKYNDLLATTTVFDVLDGFNVVERETGPHILRFLGPGCTVRSISEDGEEVGFLFDLALAYYITDIW